MLTINAEQAIESLRAVVAERGRDYVYKAELRKQIVESIVNDTEHPLGDYRSLDSHTRKLLTKPTPGDRYDPFVGFGTDPEERLRKYGERDAQNVSCTYGEGDSYDPTPSCGVGLAVYLIDRDTFVEMATVERLEGGYSPSDFEINGVAQLADGAARVYGAFQDKQDLGVPYGEALDAAEKAYREEWLTS